MCFQSLDRIHIYNKSSKSYTALNLGFTYNLASIFFNLDVSGATVGSDKTYPNPTQNSWTIKP